MADKINIFFNLLQTYGPSIGLLLTFFVFIFSVCKFWIDRRTALYWKEFEVYHSLIKELVEPPHKGALYIDRQGAVLYELRNFKRYYSYSLRMLEGLRSKWIETAKEYPRLLEELDLTVDYIKEHLHCSLK